MVHLAYVSCKMRNVRRQLNEVELQRVEVADEGKWEISGLGRVISANEEPVS